MSRMSATTSKRIKEASSGIQDLDKLDQDSNKFADLQGSLTTDEWVCVVFKTIQHCRINNIYDEGTMKAVLFCSVGSDAHIFLMSLCKHNNLHYDRDYSINDLNNIVLSYFKHVGQDNEMLYEINNILILFSEINTDVRNISLQTERAVEDDEFKVVASNASEPASSTLAAKEDEVRSSGTPDVLPQQHVATRHTDYTHPMNEKQQQQPTKIVMEGREKEESNDSGAPMARTVYESVETRKSDTTQPLQSRLQGFFKSISPVTLRRSLEARLPAAATGPLRRFFQSSKTSSAAVAAPQPKSGLPAKDGGEVASIEVMTDTGGAGVSPPTITTVAIRQDKPWRWSESNVPGIVVHEDDIPEEPDSLLNFSPSLPPSHLELSAVTPVPSPRKSPVTVQEWVDSLPHPPPPGSPITGRMYRFYTHQSQKSLHQEGKYVANLESIDLFPQKPEPQQGRRQEPDLGPNEPELTPNEVLDTSATDTLVLGAEAGHLSPSRTPSIVVEGPSSIAITPPLTPRLGLISKLDDHAVVPEVVLAANAAVIDRREQFNRARTTERMASFASDSAASNASSAGVESFLESRKLDPEKILLNLGFGGSQDSNGDLGLSRIPQRFLQPSKVKGISISQFYRHEMNLAETFETGYYGYRGLTGPNHYPSPIVAKIMERLKNRGDRDYGSVIDGQSVASAPAATTVNSEPVPDSPTTKLSPQQRFASAVQKVQQSKSVLTRIQSWKSNNQQPTGSVLNPDNRLFLQTQALSKSPDVPRRRIIMGHRSYTFSGDGDLIECKQDAKDTESEILAEPLLPDPPSEAIEIKRPKPPLVHKDSLLSSNTSFSEESEESEDEYKRKFTKRYSRRNLSLNNKVSNNTEIETTIDSPESTPTPETSSTPSLVKPNPITSNPVLQRHLSFDKRLSSTSLSSWESENWNPSPPITTLDKSKVNYNTFSSIDEIDLDRINSCDVLKQIVSEDVNVNNNDNSSIQNESQTSGRGSVSSDMNENLELVRKTSTASTRRGSLKRQSRVSVTDEENWREMSGETSSVFLSPQSVDLDNVPSSSFHTASDMSGIAEEESVTPLSAASMVLSRAGSAQSDSSGFQEGEAAAAAGATAQAPSPPQPTEPQVVAVEQKPREEMTPAHALRLEQLQQKMVSVAGGLESFRAEILAESNPEIQARIQQKVDQISAVLLHLQSLCEDLQGGQTEDTHS